MGGPVRGDYYHGYPAVGSSRPAHTGISRRAAGFLVATVVLVVAFAASHLIPAPQVFHKPGPVYNALGEIQLGAQGEVPIITVEGLPTYETSGALDLTTIIVNGGPRYRVTLWDWLMAELDPDIDVYPEEQYYPPGTTAEEVREQSALAMQSSQDDAAVVALRAAGIEVPERMVVTQIFTDAPAFGVLELEDEIVAVEGVAVEAPGQVRDELQNFEPGAEVAFTVIRDGEEQEVSVPTEQTEDTLPDGTTQTRTAVGIGVGFIYDLPYEVTIQAGSVGGPSGGAMFALAIYDIITPGELTGGLTFAGTGTISGDGAVGSIGGIRQKMIGASDAGADYFLAPAENCPQVIGNEPEGMEVISVATFDEALDVVSALGAGEEIELPRC